MSEYASITPDELKLAEQLEEAQERVRELERHLLYLFDNGLIDHEWWCQTAKDESCSVKWERCDCPVGDVWKAVKPPAPRRDE